MANVEVELKQFIADIEGKTVDELKAIYKSLMDYDDYEGDDDDDDDPKFILDLCKIQALAQIILSKEFPDGIDIDYKAGAE